jgi:hypothetical protein
MLFSVLVPIRLFLVAHLGDRYILKENKGKWLLPLNILMVFITKLQPPEIEF